MGKKKETRDSTQTTLPKVAYIRAVGATQEEVQNLSKYFKEIHNDTGIDFIITDEHIELLSPRELLKEVYDLVKQTEK